MTGVLADKLGPFDGVDYLEDDWRDVLAFRHLTRSGVLFGIDNDGAVYADSSGMQVKVPSMFFYIEGYGARWLAETVLPIGTYTVHRYDRVVVRVDFVANTIVLDIKAGTTTAVPALTQNTSIWEETLGWVDVDNNSTVAADHVHDERTGAAGRGGIINCLSTNRPAHLRGRRIIERDTQLRERVSNGTDWLWLPGTGSVVGCNVKKGATPQTLTTATYAAITLDVENWDHAALHSSSDAGFVASAAAIWAVEGWIEYAASGVNGGATWAAGSALDRYLAFHLNASAFFTSGSPSHEMSSGPGARDATKPTRRNIYKEFDLAQGDHLSLVGRQDSGGNVDVLGASLNTRIVGYNV